MKNDEQELWELVTTWMEATKTGDIKTILDLMTDDGVFLRPGHPPIVDKSAFAAAPPSNQPSPQFDSTSEIQEIQVLGVSSRVEWPESCG